MWLAYASRAFKNNQYDNRENIIQIARLRKERAQLLGYKTHAGFVLEERMAKTPDKSFEFLKRTVRLPLIRLQKKIWK